MRKCKKTDHVEMNSRAPPQPLDTSPPPHQTLCGTHVRRWSTLVTPDQCPQEEVSPVAIHRNLKWRWTDDCVRCVTVTLSIMWFCEESGGDTSDEAATASPRCEASDGDTLDRMWSAWRGHCWACRVLWVTVTPCCEWQCHYTCKSEDIDVNPKLSLLYIVNIVTEFYINIVVGFSERQYSRQNF